jgi:hypothetical protein
MNDRGKSPCGLICFVTDLVKALPGNSSVNKVQHIRIEEAVFSVDQTDAPTDWLDSNHVIYVYCRFMSVPYSSPTIDEVKKMWIYICTPPYTFMA